ncbi:(deoxy)nucleoside triphosphate pyrophosphohydrolase [Solicola sp. PLA-1-18]|uniref:(deoxy)nucleoside triphosphate pyrophosphohydrolase n=1 Tax=Solicola sp. PLA-1-18 TaxID=3380532 RepID=UPI003B7BB079
MRRTVVGVAVVHRGRLLAAERATGGWELPGGKVEPGESDADAARRELHEELEIEPAVLGPLPLEVPISDHLLLRVHVARLDDDLDVEPVLTEHADVRWVDADGLDDVGWLPADEPFVPLLRALLDGDLADRATATFDDGDDAQGVLHALEADGVAATLARETFAGEDDSEDRAWLLTVQGVGEAAALRAQVETVENAWIEPPHDAPVVAAPPLPTAPRRLKRPAAPAGRDAGSPPAAG